MSLMLSRHTAPFYVETTGPEMSEKLRVLNPIACMRSRFSNLIDLRRDSEIEMPELIPFCASFRYAAFIPTYHLCPAGCFIPVQNSSLTINSDMTRTY